jgi:hypothetical protein
MTLKLLSAGAVMALGLGLFGAADAAIDRFTATSASAGVLGFMDFDSSLFNGTSDQFIANTMMTDIHFVDPIGGFVINTPGPAGDGTFFNSSGPSILPTNGAGFTGGDSSNGVWLCCGVVASEVILGPFDSGGGGIESAISGDKFTDVSWSMTALGASVPEPASWALMILGLGAVGASLRRRSAAVVA